MKRAHAWLLILAIGTACHSVPFPTYTLDSDLGFRASMVEPVVGSQAVMRVVLRMSESETDFTLYAAVVGPEVVRMAAVADIGSTMFDVSLHGSVATVHQGSPLLGDRFLGDSFVREVAAAMLEPTRARTVAVRMPDSQRALLTRRGEDILLRREGHRRGEVVIERGVRDELKAVITVECPAASAGGVVGRPARFTIVAADASWSARVDVLEWRNAERAAVRVDR